MPQLPDCAASECLTHSFRPVLLVQTPWDCRQMVVPRPVVGLLGALLSVRIPQRGLPAVTQPVAGPYPG